MAQTDKIGEESPELAELLGDGELLAACLNLHRRIDIAEQLGVLVECSLDWCAAATVLGFGPAEDRTLLTPVGGTLTPDDARMRAVRGVKPVRAAEWLGGKPRAFDGLGPFSELLDRWPDDPPASCLALPLHGDVDAPPVGLVLALLPAAPSAEAVERFARLLRAAQPAVQNALQVRSVRELVIKDDTAQCFNRRYFESTLPAELSRASRFHAALSLIFLDMDNLKQVNNQYGHAMGSKTLLEVSRRIRAKIRRFDKLFRFGGDEFCIVLPETEWQGALEVAERVRDAIASRPFLTHDTDDAKGVGMSASLGIAAYPLHARNRKDLIEHADRAMQRIKAGTKNSIGIAEIAEGDDADE